jgi:inhibitor of KinA sporulation pathway (predicted exonuclease)
MNHHDYFSNARTIVIYDTEFTTWPGALQRGWSGENEHRELVQIAAQRIDLIDQTVLETYTKLIRPKINPQLSDFFCELTGVTQQQVDEFGVDFVDFYEEFIGWLGADVAYSYSKSIDDYTDADVLQENIDLYALDIVMPKQQFALLTPFFLAAGVDLHDYNSGKLYQAFGLELDNHHEHDALDDVRSLVASLFHCLAKI